jgi:hypothetical protein
MSQPTRFWKPGHMPAYRYRSGVPMRRITSGWPTTQELNEDLYLRRSYLTLFLNGTGYQESKLES